MRKHYHSLPAWQGRDTEIEQQIEQEWQIRDNIARTGYPDPEAQYHQHGKLTDKMTNDNADPLFIEWVYVVDPERQVLEVLANRRAKGTYTLTNWRGESYQEPNYEHYLLATYSIDGDEPKWQELEDKANEISHIAYQLFGKPV